MPVTEQAIEWFELDYVCDECKIGNMRPDGAAWMSNPPKYPHKCINQKCNAEKVFVDIRYPATAYRRVGIPTLHKG